MKITLYDKHSCLPAISGGHILVFTGLGAIDDTADARVVTEAICTYCVGEQSVVFRRNCDSGVQRFEEALTWAIGYAKAFEISDIHAVFELERPIDRQFLDKIRAYHVIDKRRGANRANLNAVFRQPPRPKRIMRIKQLPKSMLQRHPMFRYTANNKNSAQRKGKKTTLR